MSVPMMTEEQIAKLPKEAQAAFKQLLQERQALVEAVSGSGKFSVKLGQHGTIVISGFGRYPHTFYLEQWDGFTKWLQAEGFKTVSTFIAANRDKLKTKAQQVVANASQPAE